MRIGLFEVVSLKSSVQILLLCSVYSLPHSADAPSSQTTQEDIEQIYVVSPANEIGASSLEFFVSSGDANASDTNDGLSIESPFKTINRGIQEMRSGSVLTILEGVYREEIYLPFSGTESHPIIIRAYPGHEGSVIISGSEIVTGWTSESGHIWSVQRAPMQLEDYPPSWPVEGEYSRRREMVFVDGVRFQQVMSMGELSDGRFWVDDAAQKYFLYFLDDLANHIVEIATREHGVKAQSAEFIYWVGLGIEEIANDHVNAAMQLGSDNIVWGCTIRNNNQVGVSAHNRLLMLRCIVNENGRTGIALNGSNCLLDSSETSYNSWRYGPFWDAGGIKMIFDRPSNNRIIRHTARYNNGRGIWLDTTGSGNVVEASFFEGNKIAGLEFEATQGPNWAINNIVVSTALVGMTYPQEDGVGIMTREARDTHIYNNTIIDVAGAGILISGDERNDGEDFTANTDVKNNIIVGSHTAAVLFWLWGDARNEPRVSSHNFDYNLYYGDGPTIIFPDLDGYLEDYWSLEEWQNNRNQDLNSIHAPPQFVSQPTGNFALMPTSPAVDAGQNLPAVQYDFTSTPRPQGAISDLGALEYCPSYLCPPIFADGFESGTSWNWTRSQN